MDVSCLKSSLCIMYQVSYFMYGCTTFQQTLVDIKNVYMAYKCITFTHKTYVKQLQVTK